MDYNEFIALNRGLHSIPEKKNPGTQIDVGMDASAFHGRHSAQVALLQSPILRAAQSPYIGTENFRGPPVDKPHTCPSVVEPVSPSSMDDPLHCRSKFTGKLPFLR
jgi:hypothetical protein